MDDANRLIAALIQILGSANGKVADRFCHLLYQAKQLYDGFHAANNPRKRAALVAERLKVHPKTVYAKLDKLGLDMDDVHAAENFMDFFDRSSILRRGRKLIERILVCNNSRRPQTY